MKKTIRIHISGYIFNIEEDAFAILEEWLDKLTIQYSDEDGGDEIINDIEMRVAELFQQETTGENGVVSVAIVSKIIEIMGKPEDFEEEQAEHKSTKKAKKTFEKKSWKKRRVYRDQENNILGGICSGLANYFGIEPLIIRLIFIATVIFGGFGSLVYILMWIIVPKAETTAQKLEMKGEKVNISNIEKVIKDEFENVKNTLIDKTKSESFKNIQKGINDIIEAFVNFIIKVFKGLSGIVGVAFIIGGILTVILTFSFLFKNIVPDILVFNSGFFEWKPFFGLLPISASSTFASIGIFLLIAVPIIMIILVGTRILFKYRSNGKIVKYGGISLWIIGIIITSIIGMRIAENYKTTNNFVNTIKIPDSVSNTLYLTLNDSYDTNFDDPDYIMSNYNVSKIKKSLKLYGKPRLNIIKSTTGETNLELSFHANGKSKKEAFIRAQKISYNWQKEDSVIKFFPYFTINDSNKLFKRRLNITLKIPEGKSVYLDSNMIDMIYDIENSENIWDHEMIGKKWTMTKDGLSLHNEIDEFEKDKVQKDTVIFKIDTVKVSDEISI